MSFLNSASETSEMCCWAMTHGLEAHWLAVAIFYGDLALAVRAHGVIGHALPDFGQLGRQSVRKHDRQGHELGRLVAGEAEHHALVAGSLLALLGSLDAPRDVAALAVDGDPDARVVAIDAVPGVRISDLPERVPDDLLDVGVAFRRDLSGDVDRSRRRQGLDGRMGIRVLFEQVVEDGVADLVADLVGVALGDALAGEEVSVCHLVLSMPKQISIMDYPADLSIKERVRPSIF